MYSKGNEMKWNEENWQEMKRAAVREMKGTADCVEMIANGR